MKKQINDVRNEVEEMKRENNKNSEDLTTVERHLNKVYRQSNIKTYALLFILIMSLAMNFYALYYVSTTTSMETTTQEGVYNYTDSDGNIISSDLSLEDMKKILEENK